MIVHFASSFLLFFLPFFFSVQLKHLCSFGWQRNQSVWGRDFFLSFLFFSFFEGGCLLHRRLGGGNLFSMAAILRRERGFFSSTHALHCVERGWRVYICHGLRRR